MPIKQNKVSPLFITFTLREKKLFGVLCATNDTVQMKKMHVDTYSKRKFAYPKLDLGGDLEF